MMETFGWLIIATTALMYLQQSALPKHTLTTTSTKALFDYDGTDMTRYRHNGEQPTEDADGNRPHVTWFAAAQLKDEL